MTFKHWTKLALAVVLIAVALPTATPARAVTAAIGRFYASCGDFSVDVAVNGVTDDGNGLDRFRYQLTDDTGKVLYIEDSTRRVGVTAGSLVVNMRYSYPAPSKNPIRFAVVELDNNNNPGAFIQEVTFDAACLPASGVATRSGYFEPPHFLKAKFMVATGLFQSPGGNPLNITVEAGKEFFALYRSADNQWVAVDVTGNNLVWVAAGALSVDLTKLTTPPTRIDGANPRTVAASAPGAPVVVGPPIVIGQPGQLTGAVTGTVTASLLRMRAAPSVQSAILARIPYGTPVQVLGTNAPRTFIKVAVANLQGWVSSIYLRLSGSRLADLPVLE